MFFSFTATLGTIGSQGVAHRKSIKKKNIPDPARSILARAVEITPLLCASFSGKDKNSTRGKAAPNGDKLEQNVFHTILGLFDS